MNDATSDGDDRANRPARALAVIGFLAIAALAAAWRDVLPGSYFLHGLAEPHAERAARAYIEHAAERLNAFVRENDEAPRDSIVFIGSSTIERFALERFFPGKPCLNRGIRSESATLLLRFLEPRLPLARPAGIVVYTGSIDWRELRARGGERAEGFAVTGGASEIEAAARVRAVLDALQKRLPGVPIALIGVLPDRGTDSDAAARLMQLDDALANDAKKRGIAFVDVARPPITTPSGALARELSSDDVHLDDEGYRTLARWIIADAGDVGRLLAP
jgi:lysophospholipase L1-like esterase